MPVTFLRHLVSARAFEQSRARVAFNSRAINFIAILLRERMKLADVNY